MGSGPSWRGVARHGAAQRADLHNTGWNGAPYVTTAQNGESVHAQHAVTSMLIKWLLEIGGRSYGNRSVLLQWGARRTRWIIIKVTLCQNTVRALLTLAPLSGKKLLHSSAAQAQFQLPQRAAEWNTIAPHFYDGKVSRACLSLSKKRRKAHYTTGPWSYD